MNDLWRDVGLIVLGWLLGQLSALLWGIFRWHRQRRAVRKLIALENEGNLTALYYFWRDVIHPKPAGAEEDAQVSQLAEQLGRVRVPTWSHAAWESQLAHVPLNLNEEEIRWIREFHLGLDHISVLQCEITDLERQFLERQEHSRSFAERIEDKIRGRWSEFETFCTTTFDRQDHLLLRRRWGGKRDQLVIRVPPYSPNGVGRAVPDVEGDEWWDWYSSRHSP